MPWNGLPVETTEYVEIVSFAEPGARAVVTCEHGSERFFAPFALSGSDERLRGTHWAFDLGAAELTRELTKELRTTGVIAAFSRLLADPNRPEDSPDLFRKNAEGLPVALNESIDGASRERRLVAWRAYHDAVDRAVQRSDAPIVFSVHTFTPEYEGVRRAVEIGVLFDDETAVADVLAGALSRAGFRVAMNEPYSGKLGLIYSADRHAKKHGRRPIELEVRQDLAVDPAVRRRVIAASAAALAAF
jgi:predicted N-formylglutamate amidohydrolase